MKHLLLKLAWAVPLVIGACKPTESTSGTKSFIGLDAGQDASVKGKSPIFDQLSNWFQTFKTSTAPAAPGYASTSTAQLTHQLPASSTQAIISYLATQMKRADDFTAALAANDQGKIAALLDLETQEMADIALVMVDPRYTPRTSDLLAQLMASSRGNTKFLDKFAATGFLDILLQTYTLQQIVEAMEPQRLAYRNALNQRYLGGDGQALRAQIAASKQEMQAITAALQAGSGPSAQGGAALLDQAPSGSVTGVAGVLSSFLGSGKTYTDRLAAQDRADRNRQASAAAPLALLDTASGGLTYQGVPGDIPLNATTASTAGAAGASGGGGATPSGSGDASAALALTTSPLENASKNGGLRLAGTTPASAPMPPIPSPLVPCTGLSGYQIVLCHRVAGFVNLKLPPRLPPSSGSTPALGLLDTSPGAFVGVGDRIDYRAAELDSSGSAGASLVDSTATPGHVFNQGSVGSCSRQAAIGALYVAMVKSGDEPSRILALDGNKNNDEFNGKQNAAATLEDALQGAKDKATENGYTLTADPSDIDPWTFAVNCINQKKVALFGIPVDMSTWTANGGGQELGGGGAGGAGGAGGSASLSLADSDATLNCDQSGANGHAVIGVSVTASGDIVIKNSWGLDWGLKGTGVMSKASCASQAQVYCVDGKKN